MVDLIIPNFPLFSYGKMSWIDCEIDYFCAFCTWPATWKINEGIDLKSRESPHVHAQVEIGKYIPNAHMYLQQYLAVRREHMPFSAYKEPLNG